MNETSKKLKDKYSELVDFFDRPALKNRLLFYATMLFSIAVLFTIVIAIFKFIFPDFSILNNTIQTQYNTTQLNNMGFYDNERYLLSALVQSLAATIALVITLSLVAVQLAAQSYSARVIDVYKKNPDMWILLCIYIFTIFYGLGLTKIIGLGVLGNYMEGAIFAAYFMGFFAFVCLVPYIWKTLASLNPSVTMQLLAEDITIEKVLTDLKSKESIEEQNPFLPIVDIVYGAIKQNDTYTMRNGLRAITSRTTAIIENHNKENEKILAKHILQSISSIGGKAINSKSEDLDIYIIESLRDIGITAVEEKSIEFADETVIALDNIGKKAIQDDLEIIVDNVLIALSLIAKKAIDCNRESSSTFAEQTIGSIGIKAINKNLPNTVENVIQLLEKIGTDAANKSLLKTTKVSAIELDIIGKEAIKEQKEELVKKVIEALETIQLEIINNDLEYRHEIAKSIVEIRGSLKNDY